MHVIKTRGERGAETVDDEDGSEGLKPVEGVAPPMRTLYVLTIAGLVGVLVLSTAVGTLDPRAPLALVAIYNLWLLATVAVLVAALITLAFDFFSYITGGDSR